MATAEETSPRELFGPLIEEGQAELERSRRDLALSGLIAGLDIGFGPLAMAVVAGRLHATFGLSVERAILLGSFLYPLGFIVVIMGRSELFTENTLTPVAGVLSRRGTIGKLARRWGIVLTSNVLGTIAFSLLAAHTAIVFDPYKPIYRSMGLTLTSHSFLQAVLAGVFGGWLIALVAWLLHGAKSNTAHIALIYALTYLLVALQLYHCIIGSIEVLLAMFAGAPITWWTWFTAFLVPAVIGNTVGGVLFVTGFKGFQAYSNK